MPPKENNHGKYQTSNRRLNLKNFQSRIKITTTKKKTKDEVSITTKEDTNNTDKLVDLLNEGTAVLKDDPIRKPMSIYAGIDGILWLNIID